MLEHVSPSVYNFKIFWGSMLPDPPLPRGQRPWGIATHIYHNQKVVKTLYWFWLESMQRHF